MRRPWPTGGCRAKNKVESYLTKCYVDTNRGTGRALPIHNPGARRRWWPTLISCGFTRWEETPAPFAQEAEWASRSVWMCMKRHALNRVRTPDLPVHSESLTDCAYVKQVKKVKCTVVQALRLCTGRTAHRGSRGIALLFHDQWN